MAGIDKLNNLMMQVIESRLSVPRLVANVMVNKLTDKGYIFNEERLTTIAAQIEAYLNSRQSISEDSAETFTLQLDDQWLKDEATPPQEHTETINLDAVDAEDVYHQTLKELIPQIVVATGDSLLASLQADAKRSLRDTRNYASGFNKRLSQVWKKPFDLLEMLLGLSTEVGGDFNHTHRPDAAQNEDFVFDALTRLHARGCQAGHEILTLLKNGLADGAHARWRTLHELTVIASFIRDRGNNVAERYLCHADIDAYNEIVRHQQHCQALGWSPIPEKEFQQIESHRKTLLAHFGEEFKEDYGWAAISLGKKRPNFNDLEQCVSMEHMRPFFKMASLNVHASSRRTLFPLGRSPSNPGLLVAGPSFFGIGAPLRNMAYSIALLTTTLILSKPNLGNLAFAHALGQLVKRTHTASYEVEAVVDNPNTNDSKLE